MVCIYPITKLPIYSMESVPLIRIRRRIGARRSHAVAMNQKNQDDHNHNQCQHAQ
jgi:hypothetical protein